MPRSKQSPAPTNRGLFKEILRHFAQGLKIEDATSDLTVVVLPEDIVKGVANNPALCAGSLACKRAFGSEEVLWFKTSCYVQMPNMIKRYSTNTPFVKFIEKFDNPEGRKLLVEEGAKHEFILKAPIKTRRLDVMRANRERSRAKETPELREQRAETERQYKRRVYKQRKMGGHRPPIETGIKLPFSHRAMIRNGRGEVEISARSTA